MTDSLPDASPLEDDSASRVLPPTTYPDPDPAPLTTSAPPQTYAVGDIVNGYALTPNGWFPAKEVQKAVGSRVTQSWWGLPAMLIPLAGIAVPFWQIANYRGIRKGRIKYGLPKRGLDVLPLVLSWTLLVLGVLVAFGNFENARNGVAAQTGYVSGWTMPIDPAPASGGLPALDPSTANSIAMDAWTKWTPAQQEQVCVEWRTDGTKAMNDFLTSAASGTPARVIDAQVISGWDALRALLIEKCGAPPTS